MIRLGDKAKPITAEDLIRRYNLDGLSKDRKAITTLNDGLTKTNTNLENYVEVVTKDIQNLQDQVDGNITTWFFNGIPTVENQPANEWITENDKINHLGDLYYDQNTGYAYRWANIDNIYQWSKIVDADVVEALALANAAQDTADSKRRTFYDQPITPYDSGDIWIYKGEIYRCIRSREEGDWNTADWVNDLIYTDDTLANKALTDLENFTQEVRNEYVTNKVLEETEDSISSTIQSVQIQVDKKSTTFREQPTTPYKEGDVWIQNEKIYVCINTKESGEFSIDDWELNLDGGEFATKTQIEQTDRSISAVVEKVEDLETEIPTKYATKGELKVESDAINLRVDAKIDDKDLTSAEIIARINKKTGTSEAKIKADSISLEGFTTVNDNFQIDEEGNMKAVDGTFEGHVTATSGSIGEWQIDKYGNLYADREVGGIVYRTYIQQANEEDGEDTWAFSTQISKDGGESFAGTSIIYNNGDIETTNHLIVTGDLQFANNRVIPVQYYSFNSGNIDVYSGENTGLGVMEFGPGRFIVVTQFSFSANANGMRRVNISTQDGSAEANIQQGASPTGVTRMRHTQFLNNTKNTDIYWNVYQNSGSELTCNATAWIYRIQ